MKSEYQEQINEGKRQYAPMLSMLVGGAVGADSKTIKEINDAIEELAEVFDELALFVRSYKEKLAQIKPSDENDSNTDDYPCLLEYSPSQKQWHYNTGDNVPDTNGYFSISHKRVPISVVREYLKMIEKKYANKPLPTCAKLNEIFQEFYYKKFGAL